MSVDTLIRAAMDAGVQLVLADGKINVVGKGKANVIKPLLEQLRQHKAEIEQHLQTRRDTAPATVAANDPAPDADPATGTRRPPGLSKKLLAASKALDQQIVDAGLSLTPPEAPKPKLAASNSAKVNLEPPTIKREDSYDWLKPDADWKPLAMAYHAHHYKCAVCIAAGIKPGKYQRCGVGAALHRDYEESKK